MPSHPELTPIVINSLRPSKQEIHSSPAMPGLQVIVSPSGSRYFAYQTRLSAELGGKLIRPKIADIGPECTWADLEAAWEACKRYRAHADAGGDPRALQAEEAAAAYRPAAALTIAAAWEGYSEGGGYRSLRPATRNLYGSAYRTHLSAYDEKLMASINLRDIIALYDKVTSNRTEKHGIARTVIILLENLYSWADRNELLPHGTPLPTRHLNSEVPGWRSTASEARKVDIPDTHLKDFWEATYSLDTVTAARTVHRPVGAAVRFGILTGLRHKNITHLRWSHVDLESALLTIPAAEMKGKREFRLPLSDLAMRELLNMKFVSDVEPWASDGTFVFGRLNSAMHKLIREAVGVDRPIKRRTPTNAGDLPGGLLTRQLGIWSKAAGTPHNITAHSLRKTAARWAEREIDYATASRILGHAPAAHVTSTYLVDDLDALRIRVDQIAASLREFLGESYQTLEPDSSYFRMWRDVKRDKVYGEASDDDE